MDRARRHERTQEACQIIDFEEVLLDACEPVVRAELMAEADMLAGAFAPSGRPEALRFIAQALSSGERDADMGRSHAFRLAAALRRMARETPS